MFRKFATMDRNDVQAWVRASVRSGYDVPALKEIHYQTSNQKQPDANSSPGYTSPSMFRGVPQHHGSRYG